MNGETDDGRAPTSTRPRPPPDASRAVGRDTSSAALSPRAPPHELQPPWPRAPLPAMAIGRETSSATLALRAPPREFWPPWPHDRVLLELRAPMRVLGAPRAARSGAARPAVDAAAAGRDGLHS